MATTTRPNDTNADDVATNADDIETNEGGRRRTSRIAQSLAGLVVIVALTTLAGVIYQAGASIRDNRNHPAPGELIDVGGHQLHLWCTGSGTPTVVLESGLGGFSHDWSHLQPDISTQTRVCSYDRVGYGWSDGTDAPLSSAEVATDLRALLAGAGEEGPFLVVGHSLGGLHVRSFAGQYPDEIAGIVLVDSSHENQARLLTMLDPLDDATLSGLRTCDRISPFGLPRLLGVHGQAIPDSLDVSPEIRQAWESRLNQTRFCATIIAELEAIEADINQPVPPAGLGGIPLIVLSSDTGASIEDGIDVDGVTEEDLAEATRVMAGLQRQLAALSTNSTHLVIQDAGHYIHWDDPEAVTSAINDVIETWRTTDRGQD